MNRALQELDWACAVRGSVDVDLERRLASARHRHKGSGIREQGSSNRHTVRLVFAGLVTASVSYDQDRRCRVNLDIYVRVFAVSIIFSDKDGRRVELLCGEGATRHGREKSNG